MNKSSFNASTWFQDNSTKTVADFCDYDSDKIYHQSLANFCNQDKSVHSMNKFFVPGWRGESLISKNVKEFNETITKIHADVKKNFLEIPFLTSRMKSGIYNEFLSFAEFKAYNFTGIDSIQDFFGEIKNPKSEHKEKLDQFIDIYTLRTCIIFILKIRFISVFAKFNDQKLDNKNLFYPNSFLTSVFKRGSSTELNSDALKQNIYSWYRPDESLANSLKSFYTIIENISITELTKNISIISEKTLREKSDYSHSLSQKHFGLFLNSLLINYPIWHQKFNTRFKNSFKVYEDQLEIISTKYDGDYLESVSLSHWLAQEANKSIKWKQIICPSFESGSFDKGLFTKIINELQFLTFLSQIAFEQGKKPVKFICEIMKGHLDNKKDDPFKQKDLFNDQSINKSTYDRLVLNITNYPKSNPQHYILNTINKNIDTIKDNGLIFVVSSKKIFIPSQKSKIESFLKRFNLESSFDFSQIDGKGELGGYLYIFSKNATINNSNDKKSFFNFRLSGNLNTFQEFENITKLTQEFFVANQDDVPSIYAKGCNGFNFEFFQDAIVGGKMIHTSSKDSGKVTHPNFFNNLMKSCTTFDALFNVKQVKDELIELDNDYISYNCENLSPHIAIVDMRDKSETMIKIISNKELANAIYLNGKSMCFYFEISAKWPNIDVKSVNLFLKSPIGVQLTDLTFNNKLKRAKANLEKLLLPKFLTSFKSIPEHINVALNCLEMSKDSILEKHPKELQKNFNELSFLLMDLVKDYPQQVISKIATFQLNISSCLALFDLSLDKTIINFNNPILKTPLVLAKTSNIYPNNDDIFLEFNSAATAKTIHSQLTKFKIVSSVTAELKTYQIDLYSNEIKVISLYSDIEMIKFLEFLLSKAIGVTISQVIQGIKVPELENLKSIIESFNQMKSSLSDLNTVITPLTNKLFSNTINNSK